MLAREMNQESGRSGLRAGPLIKGALSFFPGMSRLLPESGGATASARYCYGVWLKHMTLLHAAVPGAAWRTVAELGPGTSLGTGIAALLSGAERYIALDVVNHSEPESNLRVFDELVELFAQRAPRPVKGWPDYDAHLNRRLFPAHLLSEEQLAEALDRSRLLRLRSAVAQAFARPEVSAGQAVSYVAPWSADAIAAGSIDLVLSHAVLGQVDEVEAAYRAMHAWLRPGGLMSHQVDFAFPGFDGRWNGYWACSDAVWRLIRGNRAFAINRLPCSAHFSIMADLGFEVVCRMMHRDESGRTRGELAPRWRELSDEDLQCSSIFVVARKR